MNLELSKKDQQLGKLRHIVKEADNRLSEMKENRQTQDFLEKKQRVLSVENNKLKHSVKRAEMQLNEKENLVESQTTISDLAAVKVPVEVVYGALDPFLTLAGMRIVEQLRGVTVHRVEANDHLVRKRLAKVVAAAIG